MVTLYLTSLQEGRDLLERVRYCVCFIAGLETEGVFRVNGNARLVENLRSSLNSESIQAVNLEQHCDVISVASLLKLFLRELPGGVVPENATKEYVQEFVKNKKGL